MPKVANLKRQVRRNIERFEGGDFMFQLTKEECLRSQIVTLNETQGRHLKYMHYAFTMLGTARVPASSSMPSAPLWQSFRLQGRKNHH